MGTPAIQTDTGRTVLQAAAPPYAVGQGSDMPPDTLEDEGFILLTELRPIIPLHPQHIRKMARRGEFPAPVQIGGRTAFRRRDIREWARQQA